MILSHLIQRSIDELRQSGVDTAEIDVRAIFKFVLSQDDIYLLTHNNELITNAQYQKFRRLIRRRKKGEPVAYLTGRKEFYGLDFKVNKNVLIPRPETELLVQEGLNIVRQWNHGAMRQCNIVDIGTGSGCIIVSIAKNLVPKNLTPSCFAIDISQKALEIAKRNARDHEVYDNIRFYKSDLFTNRQLPTQFDLILANLPYLRGDYSSLDFEPRTALDGGADGFQIVERLIKELPKRMSPRGIALLEVNDFHLAQIDACCQALGLKAKALTDINGWQGFCQISF